MKGRVTLIQDQGVYTPRAYKWALRTLDLEEVPEAQLSLFPGYEATPISLDGLVKACAKAYNRQYYANKKLLKAGKGILVEAKRLQYTVTALFILDTIHGRSDYQAPSGRLLGWQGQ